MKLVVRLFRLAAALAMLATTGCATSIAHWIVQTRDHQGDVALAHRNFADASVAYQLALKIDPKDKHAAAGLISVQVRLAQTAFAASKFDEAITNLQIAAKVSPHDERVEALRSQIEQAEIKRDIVGSNYPSYRETGAQIRRSYDGVKEQSAAISLALRRFNYTYDTADLTRAIQLSYELNSDIARYTNRMILYRQLVESGVPERSHAAERLAAPASVLPLP
jgi:tetratricopeptide (TPR) repeat protein